jgi:hypothetical protein
MDQITNFLLLAREKFDTCRRWKIVNRQHEYEVTGMTEDEIKSVLEEFTEHKAADQIQITIELDSGTQE